MVSVYSQQIKTFLQVAELGSLSKAAERLFVTPASIMKQMNALESRLEVTLLRRTNHGIEFTAVNLGQDGLFSHKERF